MSMLINGRTPEEIKTGLRRCRSLAMILKGCIGCPYNGCDGDCDLGLEEDALALIERLESERDAALAKVPKWISVKERLPEDCKDVLVWAVYHEEYGRSWALIEIDEHCKGVGWENTADPDVREVTHWMNMPQPPEEGEVSAAD